MNSNDTWCYGGTLIKQSNKSTIRFKIEAHFTQEVKANVQLKSSIPIHAKVEISPPQELYTTSQGWNRKDLFKSASQVINKCWILWPCIIGPKAEKNKKKKDTIEFGKPICNPCSQFLSIYLLISWHPCSIIY